MDGQLYLLLFLFIPEACAVLGMAVGLGLLAWQLVGGRNVQ